MLNITAREREDGLVWFSCPTLPGFRLLLNRQPDPTANHGEVDEAVRIYASYLPDAEQRHDILSAQPLTHIVYLTPLSAGS